MTNSSLALSYLRKVRARIKALHTLHQEGAYSDVIRECQEAYELMLKALLRMLAVDPPHWHDVGPVLRDHSQRLVPALRDSLERICSTSKQLRKDREMSFYGDDDFLPDESYSEDESSKSIQEVEWLFAVIVKEYGLDVQKKRP